MGTGKRRRNLAYGHRELASSKLENRLTPQKNIMPLDPGKLKGGDIVLRYQRISVMVGDDMYKPAAKFLILGCAKSELNQSNTYFECYLLWCDENYMGYHNKVGDIWQIPWYAFRDEGFYQMEFKADLSEAPAK